MANTTYLYYQCPNEDCGQVGIETEIEPAESNYGSDADGNRGIYVSAYAVQPDTPTVCPECAMEYDEDQQFDIGKRLEREAENWHE